MHNKGVTVLKDLDQVLQLLLTFRKERNWEQFHTPENLSKSIVLESTELLLNYQWGSDHANIENVKEEVSDIFSYLLLLCHDLQIDLLEETKKKIEKNKQKYPVNKVYGQSKKYNHL